MRGGVLWGVGGWILGGCWRLLRRERCLDGGIYEAYVVGIGSESFLG